jgi:cell division protein FtsN
MADDRLNEIQPQGKQLVFLFMAATVVAVVIFLCGVMVGQSMIAQRGRLLDLAVEAGEDQTLSSLPFLPNAAAMGLAGASPSAGEDLSYPARLLTEAPTEEFVRIPDSAEVVQALPLAEVSETQPVAIPGAYTVQVGAVRDLIEAERMAKRLTSKGYPAYVTRSPDEGAALYRVRVGTFTDRREAEEIAARLAKEEQFKPWITR